MAVCRCDCGKFPHIALINSMKSGRTTSCGCQQKRIATKHGLYRSMLYRKWNAMRARCNNPKSSRYKEYGGRGISICDRWKTLHAFIDDMGPTYFSGAEIDRKDVNGNYEPSNCRWLTHVEQASNKRSNVLIEWRGKNQCITHWANELGIPMQALRMRLSRYGWSVERAFTTPSMNADVRCAIARGSRKRSSD